MRFLMAMVLLAACGQKDEAPPPPAPPPTPVADAAPRPVDAPPDDGSGEVAKLVVHDVGSKALGSQTIEETCVSVVIIPAGDWSVASARLNGCGDKTAKSIVWLFKRQGNGKWNEDYAGQPPKCWKGVPSDLRPAVAAATRIPAC